MKRIVCLFLAIALILCMSTNTLAASGGNQRLSSLSGEECIEFLKENGIALPAVYEDDAAWAPFVKEIIEQVEENPNQHFVFGNAMLLELAQDIRAAVNKYYGVSPSAMQIQARAVSSLQDNTVYGNWSDDYENYNCYAYAIGYEIHLNPGQLKWMSNGNAYSTYVYNDLANAFTVAEWIQDDLESIGCTVNAPTTTMPSTNVSIHNRLICVRTDTDGQYYSNYGRIIYDYHVMKKETDGYWYHKPGETNPLCYKYTPSNSRIWVSESYTPLGGYQRDEDFTYESTIYYINYTTPHSWGYEYYKNNTHIKTCTDCGTTTGVAMACQYVNNICKLCGHYNFTTIESVGDMELYQ